MSPLGSPVHLHFAGSSLTDQGRPLPTILARVICIFIAYRIAGRQQEIPALGGAVVRHENIDVAHEPDGGVGIQSSSQMRDSLQQYGFDGQAIQKAAE